MVDRREGGVWALRRCRLAFYRAGGARIVFPDRLLDSGHRHGNGVQSAVSHRQVAESESPMFTITESAAEAINHLTTAQDVRVRGGLRMTLNGLPEDGAALSVEIAAHPAPGDDVIDAAGTQVFLARETRVLLSDKFLDVRKDIDGHFTFLVATSR
ncbi:hypothetical protein [Amycolatopsis sp. w19]|uniref:hypothetical protein n=1 Tax=Amycolatopsis sp. w19 TaxID=3448134 RepID=UPI003F1CE745